MELKETSNSKYTYKHIEDNIDDVSMELKGDPLDEGTLL